MQSRSAWEDRIGLDFEIVQLRRSVMRLSAVSATLKYVSASSELPLKATCCVFLNLTPSDTSGATSRLEAGGGGSSNIE